MLRLALVLALVAPTTALAAPKATLRASEPMIDCPGSSVLRERVLKKYATDLSGRQVWRFYMRLSWCTRRTGLIVKLYAAAWGECGACGSYDYGGIVEGPSFSTEVPSTRVRVYARGRFAYIVPPWIGPTAGYLYPWIRATLVGRNYRCASGVSGTMSGWGYRPRKCVRARGGFG